jgi:hypothetical protein
MPRETIENVNQQTGMGNILISVYKYLRDRNILKGTFKNPLVVQQKARVPETYVAKVKKENSTLSNYPILSYKNTSTDKAIRIMTFSAAVKSNKPVEIDILKNPTLNTPTWIPYDGATEIEKDISSTSISGGTLVGGVDIPETSGTYESLGNQPVIFCCMPGETITLSVNTSGNSDVYIRVRLEIL